MSHSARSSPLSQHAWNKNGTASAVFAEGTYFFGADGLDGILTKVSNASEANNVLMLTPFAGESSSDAKVSGFVKKYKEAYGAAPDQFAADGYDAIYAIKAAVEKAGYTKAADIKGEGLSAALVQVSLEGVTGDMKWQANGNTDKSAMAIIYKDGNGTVFGE